MLRWVDLRSGAQRPFLVLGVVSLSVFLAALDLTVVTTILPQVIFDLRVPITKLDQAAWIVTAYLLAYTITMPVMGRVSDLFGRRLVFLIALALFIAGSFLCARSDSLISLIMSRVVQALGGGAMVPVSMAIVGDIFPTRRRGFALGVIGAVDTAGWVIGPLYGAVLSQLLGTWRWIFWINLPLGILCLLLVLLVVPGRQADRLSKGIDYLGAIVLAGALVALNLGLSSRGGAAAGGANPFAQETALLPGLMIPLLAIAAALFLAFVVREHFARQPIIELKMFRSRSFTGANSCNLLVGAALIIAMVDVPIFITIRGGTALESAQALAPLTLAMLVGALLGGILSDRAGHRATAVAGLVVSAGGFLLMRQWTAGAQFPEMARDLALCGFGFGMVIAPVGSAVIEAVARTHFGIASALVIIMRLVGMTVGLSSVTGWALNRMNEQLALIPPMAQKVGESAADFQQRFGNYYWQASVKITVSILNDVFFVGAVLVLVAVVPALLMRRSSKA